MNSPEGHTKRNSAKDKDILETFEVYYKNDVPQHGCGEKHEMQRSQATWHHSTPQHLGTTKTGVPGRPRLSHTLDSGVNHPGRAGPILLTWQLILQAARCSTDPQPGFRAQGMHQQRGQSVTIPR